MHRIELLSISTGILENHEGIKRCYIMTIGCLDKYRRLGVGTTLLNYILETAKADGCVKATLHVQVRFQLMSFIQITDHKI